MSPHPNAPLTPKGRQRLCERIDAGRPLAHVVDEDGVRREVVPDDIQRLKQQPGGDMVVGGANLASTFARYGLIDEYRIYMQPVVLDAGHPLFPSSEKRLPLRLIDTHRFGNGVVLLHYTTG